MPKRFMQMLRMCTSNTIKLLHSISFFFLFNNTFFVCVCAVAPLYWKLCGLINICWHFSSIILLHLLRSPKFIKATHYLNEGQYCFIETDDCYSLLKCQEICIYVKIKLICFRKHVIVSAPLLYAIEVFFFNTT